MSRCTLELLLKRDTLDARFHLALGKFLLNTLRRFIAPACEHFKVDAFENLVVQNNSFDESCLIGLALNLQVFNMFDEYWQALFISFFIRNDFNYHSLFLE
jgi:hypothetical protein